MFNGDLRDKLLFEDAEFTYSRRYFWAFQTLGLMNDSIKAIMDAYEDTFTDDVWEGKHKSMWPMIDQASHRNSYYLKKMANLKPEFEKEIRSLAKLFEENDDRRKEIRTLRDQLFSGTSVLESRKSVELSGVTILQGHNIKLLTLVISLRTYNAQFLPITGLNLLPSSHIRHLRLRHVKHAVRRLQRLHHNHGRRLRSILPAHWLTQHNFGHGILAVQVSHHVSLDIPQSRASVRGNA